MELDSIYEEVLNYHINDYIIFEGVLRRDILEANGILNEEGNKNFLKNMLNRALEALKNMREKIVEFFKNLRDKFFYNDGKVDKIVEKYHKYFLDKRADELLNDFKVKNFKVFYCIKIMPTKNLYTKDPVDVIYDYWDREEDLEKLRNKVNNIESVKEEIHEKIWTAREVEYPFKDNKELNKYLREMLTELTINDFKIHFENKEKNYLKWIDEEQKFYETKLKEYQESKFEDLAKQAQIHLKALPLVQTLILKENSIVFKEVKDLFVACVKLYKSAGKYLESKLGGKESQNASYLYDIDYINAVTEAEIYELSL